MKKSLINYYPGDLRNLLLEGAEKAGIKEKKIGY